MIFDFPLDRLYVGFKLSYINYLFLHLSYFSFFFFLVMSFHSFTYLLSLSLFIFVQFDICLYYLSPNLVFYFYLFFQSLDSIYPSLFLALYSIVFFSIYFPSGLCFFLFVKQSMLIYIYIFVVDTQSGLQCPGRKNVKNLLTMPQSFSLMSEYIEKTIKIVLFMEVLYYHIFIFSGVFFYDNTTNLFFNVWFNAIHVRNIKNRKSFFEFNEVIK